MTGTMGGPSSSDHGFKQENARRSAAVKFEDKLRALPTVRPTLYSETKRVEWFLSVEQRDALADLVDAYRELSRHEDTVGGAVEEMWDAADDALARLDSLS